MEKGFSGKSARMRAIKTDLW